MKIKLEHSHYEGILEVAEIQIHPLILAHRPADNRDHAVNFLSSVYKMIATILRYQIITHFLQLHDYCIKNKVTKGLLYVIYLCQLVDSYI